MSATSVTGKGLGSADKRHKGSEHLRVGAEKIIGPRVVYAAKITLSDSGTASVILPAFSGETADYIVVATDNNTSSAAATGAALAISGSTTTITLKGTNDHIVQVAAIKVGLAV